MRWSLTVLLLAFVTTGHAQRGTLSIDLFAPVLDSAGVSGTVEFAITEKHGILLRAFKRIRLANDTGGFHSTEDVFGIDVGYRYYTSHLNQDAPRGIGLTGWVGLGRHAIVSNIDSLENRIPGEGSLQMQTLRLSVEVSYQWLFFRHLALSLGLTFGNEFVLGEGLVPIQMQNGNIRHRSPALDIGRPFVRPLIGLGLAF